MSYSPFGAPDDVLDLALRLASEAQTIRQKFEETEDISLGDGVEQLRPLWLLIEELDTVIDPARSRWLYWQNSRSATRDGDAS